MLELEGPVVIAGDWHGSFGEVSEVVHTMNDANTSFTCIIHLGDLGIFSEQDIDDLSEELHQRDLVLYFIDGNHENHPLLRSYPVDSNGIAHLSDEVKYITRGTRFSVDGHPWLGLGGAASVDRAWRTEGLSWWPEEIISDSDVEKACSAGEVKVLLTHDAPPVVGALAKLHVSGIYFWPKEDLELSSENSSKVLEVIQATKPSLVLHGHWHYRYSEVLTAQSVDGENFQFLSVGLDREGTYENLAALDGEGNFIRPS